MENKIKNICGDLGDISDLENLGNNPNFVFKNDPNFETVILFDSNNNIINVNSWLECANYVNGGWTNSTYESFNGEQFLFLFTLSTYMCYLIYKRFLTRRGKSFKI